MKHYFSFVIVLCALLLIGVEVGAQTRKPWSITDIEELVRGEAPAQSIVERIEKNGVNFELTPENRKRLQAIGAADSVLRAVQQAAADYKKRKEEQEAAARRAQEQQEKERQRQAAKERQPAEREEAEKKKKPDEAAKQKADENAQRKAATEQRSGRGEMVEVPAGEFFMGCNEQVATRCWRTEKPERKVYLPAFKIDKTEVTVAEYRRCVEVKACTPTKRGFFCNWNKVDRLNYPINCVDWNQAAAFCAWAGKRLPTVAEWEKAARGTDGRTYPWGNKWEESKANIFDTFHDTAPVGSFPAGTSPYGALDMAGNVREWTIDEGENESGKYRKVRGGSWIDSFELDVTTFSELRFPPDSRREELGFRCVQSDIAVIPDLAVVRESPDAEEYRVALQAFQEQRYDNALQQFRLYQRKYPLSELADDAQYWIGESYFVQKDYNRAILEFNDVLKYRGGDKVPAALFRQAQAFLEIGDKTDARLILQKLSNDHPNSYYARQAQKQLQTLAQ